MRALVIAFACVFGALSAVVPAILGIVAGTVKKAVVGHVINKLTR